MTENYTIKDIIDKVKKNKRWPDTKIIQKAYNSHFIAYNPSLFANGA